MDEAIEIVQAMYDEAEASYIMVGEATLERIGTLEEVLDALKTARKNARAQNMR